MKNYTRDCPVCNKTIKYSSKQYLDRAVKQNRKCSNICGKSIKDEKGKYCPKCKTYCLNECFNKNLKNNSLQSWCKECKKEQKQIHIKKNKNRTEYSDKKCIVCFNNKAGAGFAKHSHSPDGLSSTCKLCDVTKQKQYINKIRSMNKIYKNEKECCACKIVKSAINFGKNKCSIDGMNSKCKKCVSIHNKRYKKPYKDKSITEKLRDNIRSRTRKLLIKRPVKTIQALGCSINKLILHLEKQFYCHKRTGEFMTWENKGLYGWHVDHIIPLSYFDLTDPVQFKKACHYTNLQPLWAEDNYKKGDKLINI